MRMRSSSLGWFDSSEVGKLVILVWGFFLYTLYPPPLFEQHGFLKKKKSGGWG